MMHRILSGTFPLLLALTGPGAASSLLVLPAASGAQGPSIVLLGEPAAGAIEALPRGGTEAETFSIGGSMVAFGADAIPVAGEPVASIGDARAGEKPLWTTDATPLVIRGGMIGDAFSAPPAPDVTPPQAHAPSPDSPSPDYPAPPEAARTPGPHSPPSPSMTPR